MSGRSHRATICISESHPALPGHFPGRPIVPGVVLLDHVVASAEGWLQQSVRVTAIKQVKFLAPLLPQQEAAAELSLDGQELRFALRRGEDVIAQGALNVSLEVAA
jgi:3-hydroxymyristoyl/3-hydroxydecanoyl-(acyl carrier protein) dehydratase